MIPRPFIIRVYSICNICSGIYRYRTSIRNNLHSRGSWGSVRSNDTQYHLPGCDIAVYGQTERSVRPRQQGNIQGARLGVRLAVCENVCLAACPGFWQAVSRLSFQCLGNIMNVPAGAGAFSNRPCFRFMHAG